MDNAQESIISQFLTAFAVSDSAPVADDSRMLVQLAENQFKVSIGQNDWFLKILKRPSDQIEKENKFLNALHARAGELFTPYLKTKFGESFLALRLDKEDSANLVAMPFIEHDQAFDWTRPKWSMGQSAAAGSSLRFFHNASKASMNEGIIDAKPYEPVSPQKKKRQLSQLLESPGLAPKWSGACLPPLEMLCAKLACQTFDTIAQPADPLILHGDFHAGNLLFKKEKVRAVIDLDAAFSYFGDAEIDLAYALIAFSAPWTVKTFSDKSRLEDCLRMDHFEAFLEAYYENASPPSLITAKLQDALIYSAILFAIWAIESPDDGSDRLSKVLSTAANILMALIKTNT